MPQSEVCCEVEKDLTILLDDCDQILIRGEVHLAVDGGELVGGVGRCRLDDCVMGRVVELVEIVVC